MRKKLLKHQRLVKSSDQGHFLVEGIHPLLVLPLEEDTAVVNQKDENKAEDKSAL